MQEASFFADPRSWVAVAFVIFFVIFGAKLWQALAGMLDKRTASVKAELEEASRLRREAEAMLADASKRREAALVEARALLDGARAEATRLARSAAEEAEVGWGSESASNSGDAHVYPEGMPPQRRRV